MQTETVVISDEDDADDIVPIEANVSLSTPHVPGRLLRSARKPAASSRQISRAEVGESSTSGLISPSKSIRPSDGSPEAMHHRHLSPGPRIQAAEGSRRVMEPETPRRSSRRRARFLLDEGERLDEIAEGGQEVPEDDGPTSSRPAYTPSSSSLPAAAVTARPAQTSTSAPRRPASPSGDAEAGPSRLYPSLPVFPSVPTALASSSSMTLSGTGLGPVPHGAKASIKRLVSSGSGILSTSTATTTTSARPIRRAPLRVRPDDPLHPTASLAAAPSRARATASSGSGARASARNVQAAFTRPRALDRTSASSGSSGDSGNSNSARLPQAKKRNEENRAVGSTEEDGSKEAGGRVKGKGKEAAPAAGDKRSAPARLESGVTKRTRREGDGGRAVEAEGSRTRVKGSNGEGIEKEKRSAPARLRTAGAAGAAGVAGDVKRVRRNAG